MQALRCCAVGLLALFSTSAFAQDSLETLLAAGEALYHHAIGCWTCHGVNAEGLVAPSLRFGPSPVEIFDEFDTNPLMAAIAAELDPSDEDLVAVSLYIRTMVDLPVSLELAASSRAELAAYKVDAATPEPVK
jgi:mono/diheme cytochrome c family protein